MTENLARQLQRRIRLLLILFIIGLILSGITAVPLVSEVGLLEEMFGPRTGVAQRWPAVADWIDFLHRGLTETAVRYPFLLYGTDWLAFAHIVIGIAFWGPLRDPIKNIWVVDFGLIACSLVIPAVLIFGPLRGIPVFWRAIDCSFGVLGFVPLALVRRDIQRLSAIRGGWVNSAADCVIRG